MTDFIEEQDAVHAIKKLMSGFCSPRKGLSAAPSYEEDDAEATNKYAPDLAPQTPSKQGVLETPPATPESEDIAQKEDETEVVPEEKPEEPDQPAPAETEETPPAPTPTDDSEAPKKATEIQKARGPENFILKCIFLLVTVLALKKLGFTTSDLDLGALVGGGNGSSPSWIEVVDKQESVGETIAKEVPVPPESEEEPVVAEAVEQEEVVATEETYGGSPTEATTDATTEATTEGEL
ncbi:unnamed protein product [Pseudo-nitzschia multistriata]|uniref:Uncharacterized protein n=1 Tax=Pseudo-nitzschia multistriata TaxID=183589 RepID=A0A448ZKF0_9STRA|nr:unnamed protein product [Pseudo-nitzschia multistriata]